jgi:hypothetical protein
MRFLEVIVVLIFAGSIAAFVANSDGPIGTNAGDARRALQASGFTEIETGGYEPWACSQDDAFHTKFTAVNTSGQRVSGVVCSGLYFKNATIRF